MLQEIKIFIKHHKTLLKRGLLIANIFLMLGAIQIYMNYLMIIETTESVKAQNQKVQDEIDYINNYQLKFLNSEHAKHFLAHENNILGVGETVIAFKEKKAASSSETTPTEIRKTPREERKTYFREKRKK